MTKTNIFANLMGRGRPQADDAPGGETGDDEAIDDGPTEEEEGSDGGGANDASSDSGDAGSEAEGGEGDSDEERAAYARGRVAERSRIAAILGHSSVGPHNIAQAAHIATGTDLSPAQAAPILGSASTGGTLGARLARHDTTLQPGRDGDQAKPISLKERAEQRRNKT